MKIFESDRLPALAAFLGELASAADAGPEAGSPDEALLNPGLFLAVSEIKVDLPFELDLVQDSNTWRLAADAVDRNNGDAGVASGADDSESRRWPTQSRHRGILRTFSIP